jgi:hypothetical protein
MAPRYKIHIKDTSGTLVGILTDWKRLEINPRLNDIGEYSLVIDGESSNVSLFVLDAQIEVWRCDADAGIAWYKEYEGLHRTEKRETRDNGESLYTSKGVGYNDLLDRRIILYNSGSAYTDKSAAGETVMKEYVDENAGPSATSAPRLLESGVTTGLSVEADAAAGAAWSGAEAFKKLLSTLQNISNATSLDFGIVGTGAALFEFRVKASPWGADRTNVGLVHATGLNGAGNTPIVFALEFGNMIKPDYSLSRTSEINSVISEGQGLSGNRMLTLRTNAGAIAESPWNLRESSRGASDEYTTAQQQSGGDAFLADNQAKETFTFDVMQIPSCLYGRDYFFGDLVTVRYKTIERSKKIVGVNITLENGREDISLELSDVG